MSTSSEFRAGAQGCLLTLLISGNSLAQSAAPLPATAPAPTTATQQTSAQSALPTSNAPQSGSSAGADAGDAKSPGGSGEKFGIYSAMAQVSTSSSQITAAVTYYSDSSSNFDNTIIGLTLKLPATSADNDAETELDQYTSSKRVGLVLAQQFHSRAYKMQVRLLPEWGIQQFVYYPNAGSQSTKSWKQSFDATADWFYYINDEHKTIQAIVRFADDWSASPAVGVVTPATTTTPALVAANKVVADAVTQPSITGRLFYYMALEAGSPWAIGPSVALSYSGAKGRTLTFDNTVVGRAELWLYFRPGDASPANLRLGVAPYVSDYFKGQGADGRKVIPGALFQVRVGSNASPDWTY